MKYMCVFLNCVHEIGNQTKYIHINTFHKAEHYTVMKCKKTSRAHDHIN